MSLNVCNILMCKRVIPTSEFQHKCSTTVVSVYMIIISCRYFRYTILPHYGFTFNSSQHFPLVALALREAFDCRVVVSIFNRINIQFGFRQPIAETKPN